MGKWGIIGLIVVLFFLFVRCQSKNKTRNHLNGRTTMQLVSSAFDSGGMIPVKYTCDGEDISPALKWNNAPAGTKTFALIADDPDAPRGTWVHWVIYNIPGNQHQLKEGIPALRKLTDGTLQGTNDFGKIGYGGPCPPNGVHRYYFKLYALDTVLAVNAGISKAELLKKIEGHILAKTELMGRYMRQKIRK